MTIPTIIEDKILQHEDIRDSNYLDFTAYHFRKYGNGVPPSLYEAGEFAIGEVKARVDDGRWIVDCQNCNSAAVVSSRYDVFICAECGSPDNGGAWRVVVYPEAREEIERLLLLRPANLGRGFVEGTSIPVGGSRFYAEDDVNLVRGDTTYRLIAGQTVEELKAENEELGCGV